MWFTESDDGKIGRISPQGEITEFKTAAGTSPRSLSGGRSGLWFTEAPRKIARIDAQGQITEFDLPAAGLTATPDSLVEAADGSLWYRVQGQQGGTAVGRITPDGNVTSPFVGDVAGGPAQRQDLSGLIRGSNGGVWFVLGNRLCDVCTGPYALIHIDNDGIQRYPFPGLGAVKELIAGPADTIWFTQQRGVGRFTLGEIPTVAKFSLPDDLSDISHPAFGPDGSLWVSAQQGPVYSKDTRAFLLNVAPGSTQRFELPGPSPFHVTSTAIGLDGAPWFLPYPDNFLGRLGSDGKVTLVMFQGSPAPYWSDLLGGPDGALWFVDNNNSSPYAIYRFKP